MFLKQKFEFGPKFTGKTIEVIHELGSESAEPQVVNKIPVVDGSQLKQLMALKKLSKLI